MQGSNQGFILCPKIVPEVEPAKNNQHYPENPFEGYVFQADCNTCTKVRERDGAQRQ